MYQNKKVVLHGCIPPKNLGKQLSTFLDFETACLSCERATYSPLLISGGARGSQTKPIRMLGGGGSLHSPMPRAAFSQNRSPSRMYRRSVATERWPVWFIMARFGFIIFALAHTDDRVRSSSPR